MFRSAQPRTSEATNLPQAKAAAEGGVSEGSWLAEAVTSRRGSRLGVAPRPVQAFRRGGRAQATPQAAATATAREAGRLAPGEERWPRTHTQSGVGAQVCPNCRASSFYPKLRPSHARGCLLSPHQPSLPQALSPSEDLNPRSDSSSRRLSTDVHHLYPTVTLQGPKTARPGLSVSGSACCNFTW